MLYILILFQVPDIRMSIVLPQLKQIFPDHEDSQLQSALENANFNLTSATEIILGQGG
jgi:hypothetical protein